ncbi:lipid-A-disaccharide synthase [Sphaerospermopsis kisseleviana CS-549]|uniref:Lipid-A-disaccharide synthase n=2 Tax=Sphaerospermopsis TaxID=752201 RepID=A0A479ZTG4_9CYAN|nr:MULTISPECIES: lipid-A-disaccharide synthase [Sphaerospermopsis]MDB9441127.1 lipid-A-disaccharide synthase [Sphaerospermopsis kisseleviana CS-549]BAZ81815.1 lipid-A-disaccharide synthase [Sphaerospermopsis kisseleviana NIES-73]GCL34916.1 lipid-A-disaccharide synthase [Sphaerospermopsis reniformis]
MRIFISTGEVSGDLQGALLITALQNQAQALGLNLDIVALGGEKMAAAGATILGDTSGIGSMGIIEALPYFIPTIQVQKRAIAYLQKNPPDIIVLIDYMTPNIGIGSYMNEHFPDVPVVYYIAPQEWVWSMSLERTKKIVSFTDKLLAIFPEEARYYQEKGAKVNWVGHPLVDKMANAPSRETAREMLGIKEGEIAIALLPASRSQELKYLLPVIFQAAQNIQSKLPTARFFIPLSLEKFRDKIEKSIQNYGLKATILSGKQQEIFAAVDLAITKSGTANLELALANVPQVVVYSLSPFTAWVARKILKGSIPFASPVNLVVMREIVPEFLQEQATVENITQAGMELLLNTEKRERTLLDYQEMRQCLGDLGVCDRAAKEILEMR